MIQNGVKHRDFSPITFSRFHSMQVLYQYSNVLI